jgi:hypothetical protein
MPTYSLGSEDPRYRHTDGIPNPAVYAVMNFISPTNLIPGGRVIATGGDVQQVAPAALAIFRDVLRARPDLAPEAVLLVYRQSQMTPVLTIGPLDLDMGEAA